MNDLFDPRRLRMFDVKGLGETIYENRGAGEADIVVAIPLYNYAHTITDALESVVKQDLPALAVIVVDDSSTDDSGQRAVDFLVRHPARFSRAQVVRHHLEQQAVSDILWLLKSGSRSLHPVNGYVLFLKRLRTTFEAIFKLFPRFNTLATPDLKDISAIGTSPDEMLCISHHLRVLTSYGLRGPLAEFGCFKGFSSSCLSHACHELGIELHVFDSFAGLPPSESTYYQAGEFAGTFEEVSSNVSAFGKIDNVQFFRGFFSATVPGYDKEPLAIWIDVDLASSAEDAMRILPQMPVRGVVFTHEWPEGLLESSIERKIDVRYRHANAVLPPVVSAFEARGGDPVGRFLCGRLGAIWDQKQGVRPLGIEAISTLCDAI